jgi:site-specific DNA recombinase
MKAALYARVSTRQQQAQRTIDSQIALLRQYATQTGYAVEEAYVCCDEGFSGATLARPGLDRLRDGAQAGQFDIVLVLCPDRLSRKYAYLILIQEELERLGVPVRFLEQPPGDDPHSALLTQIQGAVAEYERAKLAERYRRGKLHRARQGEIFWTSVPYGYRHTPRRDGVPAHVEIDPEPAAIIQQIFTWHAGDEVSLRQIAKRLTASSIPAPRGSNRWGTSTIHRIVCNEAYTGTLFYNRTQRSHVRVPLKGNADSRVPTIKVALRPREEWIPVSIPAIITHELFARSLARHELNRRFSPRRLKEERWLLRGLLRCAECGYKHVSVASGIRGQRGQRTYYYRCGRSDGMSDRPPCRPSVTHAGPLDEWVWQTVCQHLVHPELLVRAQGELAADIPLAEGFLVSQLHGAQQRLHQTKAERKRLLDAYQGGFLSQAEFEGRARKLVERIGGLEKDLQSLQRDQRQAIGEKWLLDRIEDFSHAVTSRLDTMSFPERQKLMRAVLHEVVLDGDQVHLYFKIPLPPPKGGTTKGEGEGEGAEKNGSVSSKSCLRSRSDQAVEVNVAIERRAEAVHEGDGSEAGAGRRAGAGSPQRRFDGPQVNPQHGADRLGPVAQEPAHSLGHREHPLAHGHARQHAVGQRGRRLDHAPRVAAGAQAPRAAGKRHQEVEPAARAAHAGEAVGQDAAF